MPTQRITAKTRAAKNALNRVFEVDKAVLQAELHRQVFAQRANAVAFGRVVTRSDKGNIRLARKVHGLLGNLTGNIGVDAELHGILEITLCRAGAPCDATNRAIGATDHLWRARQALHQLKYWC